MTAYLSEPHQNFKYFHIFSLHDVLAVQLVKFLLAGLVNCIIKLPFLLTEGYVNDLGDLLWQLYNWLAVSFLALFSPSEHHLLQDCS